MTKNNLDKHVKFKVSRKSLGREKNENEIFSLSGALATVFNRDVGFI